MKTRAAAVCHWLWIHVQEMQGEVTSSRSRDWYVAFVPILSAYLSVKCVAKGVSPFHNDRTPSSLMIVWPQLTMPAGSSSQLLCFLFVAYCYPPWYH